VLVGLAPLAVYGFSTPDFAQAFGSGAMAAAAALMVGGLLGFLFGIPRALQQDADPAPTTSASVRSGYRVNTNLEQISDWLTKILVGVGLTQIPAIGEAVGQLITGVAEGMGTASGASSIAGTVLIYFAASGFLGGYFLTRTVLARMFTLSDAEMSLMARMDQVEQLSKDAKNQSEQVARDMQALSLVEHLLTADPTRDGAQEPLPNEDDLVSAFQGCPADVLRLVFDRARELRRTTWETDKARMARTIPIFRALIKFDPGEYYHRPRGQLGFALKDQEQPQWRHAEEQLTAAIRIREKRNKTGFRIYEFNRALCRIALHGRSRSDQDSGESALRSKIMADLRAAAHDQSVRDMIQADIKTSGAIGVWLARNNLTADELNVQPQAPSRQS
jgi:hypothetical protein